MNMTKSEKEDLVAKVTDLTIRDVLQREDMVGILEICRDACERRIVILEDRTNRTQ